MPTRPSTQPAVRTLRIAVTDRCNLHCAYCRPLGAATAPVRSGELSFDELTALAAWLHRRCGLTKIKITGGEPLVRDGITDFVTALTRLDDAPEISLTTNGTHLAPLAAPLKRAGLARVNVSLDTPDAERFKTLTGGDVHKTIAGIHAARDAGLTPIKLNAVLRRNTYRQDVPELLDLAADLDLQVRFIELMRTGTAPEWCDRERITVDAVMAWLRDQPECGELTAPSRGASHAPASLSRIDWRGASMTVGWIPPISCPFCAMCDRLRLSPRGEVRRCLMDPTRLPLHQLITAQGDAEAEAALATFLAGKHPPVAMDQTLSMSELGG